jgi:hypothetical protein
MYVCLSVRLVPSTCICTLCGSNSYLIRPSQCSASVSGRALSLVLSLKASTLTSSVTWRQHAPLKRLSTVTRLHGAVSQKAVIFSFMQVFIISFFCHKGKSSARVSYKTKQSPTYCVLGLYVQAIVKTEVGCCAVAIDLMMEAVSTSETSV